MNFNELGFSGIVKEYIRRRDILRDEFKQHEFKNAEYAVFLLDVNACKEWTERELGYVDSVIEMIGDADLIDTFEEYHELNNKLLRIAQRLD